MARAAGLHRPWVLPPGNERNRRGTYTIQSLWVALKAAETRAGIGHATGRGGHGLRRMLAGDVTELTGDAVLGLHAIGDTDIRQAQRYIKRRDDRLQWVFDALDGLGDKSGDRRGRARFQFRTEPERGRGAREGHPARSFPCNHLRNWGGRIRTCDLPVNSRALCQLSYTPS